tara:strand:+ start:1219 stop:1986 length:768 start_codon:yes stop_codon:yes gene_type:complete
MCKFKISALTFIATFGLSATANAEPAVLASDDFVGISFWIISMGTLAATAFFFVEKTSLVSAWRTPLTVSGIVTGIAFIHYIYIRDVWIQTGDLSTVYRYIEWLITMPLQMIVFYLILSVLRRVSNGMFWRLLIGTLVMVIGGYLGEAGHIPTMLGLVIWMAGWVFILYEVFSGEAGKTAAKIGSKPVVAAFSTLRMIVTVGWSIYPLGYIFSYLTGGVDVNSLNVIYNFADFVNKIAFGLVIWTAAVSSGGRSR